MNPFEWPLHFLRPWWWLALAPLPLAWWLLARAHYGRAMFVRLVDPRLLPHLLDVDHGPRRWSLALFALAWLLAVTALAGPAWQKVSTPLYVNGAARVVVLSLSQDMLAEDLKPNRMTRARFAVRDLLDAAGDARTALVAFAGAAFTVAPLTDDKRTVENLLRALRPDVMPVAGNDAAAGIGQALQLLQQSHVRGGEIVLVTDTAGPSAIAAAKAARAHGIRVDVLGIGTPGGAPVPRAGGGFASAGDGMVLARRDDVALRALAQAGGGSYVVLQADGSGVAALPAPVASAAQASRGRRGEVWRDGGAWLLPVLVVLAALAFRRGWLLVIALLVLPIGMPVAHAASWSAWFANRDQQALHALQRGNADQARDLARSQALRGAADYRAGDFADAAKAFARGDDARSRYNLGNALAQQGEYHKAIAAYRQALQRDPGMADARANIGAVEAWLKHQQKPPSQRPSGQQSRQARAGQPASSSASSSSAAPVSAPAGQPSPSSGKPSPSSSAAESASSKPGGKQSVAGPQGSRAPASSVGGTPAAKAARERAEQGLAQALQQARAPNSSARDTPQTFMLGQAGAPHGNGRLDAEQRALLRAVPDDPGALLRRKFRLEWQQRQGQTPAPEDDQP